MMWSCDSMCDLSETCSSCCYWSEAEKWSFCSGCLLVSGWNDILTIKTRKTLWESPTYYIFILSFPPNNTILRTLFLKCDIFLADYDLILKIPWPLSDPQSSLDTVICWRRCGCFNHFQLHTCNTMKENGNLFWFKSNIVT